MTAPQYQTFQDVWAILTHSQHPATRELFNTLDDLCHDYGPNLPSVLFFTPHEWKRDLSVHSTTMKKKIPCVCHQFSTQIKHRRSAFLLLPNNLPEPPLARSLFGLFELLPHISFCFINHRSFCPFSCPVPVGGVRSPQGQPSTEGVKLQSCLFLTP